MLDVLADDGDAHFVISGRADALEHLLPVVDHRPRAALVRLQLLDDQLVELVVRPGSAALRRSMKSLSLSSMTARRSTLQNRAIFSRSSLGNSRSVRQISMSGWIPIWRSWPTRVLRRLGLQLAGRLQIRHQRQVDVQAVLLADVERELADRFEERHALDVADRAADFGDDDVDVVGVASLRDGRLDFVGDVRNHLHGLAQVLAAAAPC